MKTAKVWDMEVASSGGEVQVSVLSRSAGKWFDFSTFCSFVLMLVFLQ